MEGKNEDLVLVRPKNTFSIGFAEFDESGKLTLKYPGHQNLEWEAGELDQIVKIQGVISKRGLGVRKQTAQCELLPGHLKPSARKLEVFAVFLL